MQSVIFRADESLIKQIIAVSKALASTTNQSLETLSIEQLKAEAEHAERIANYQADLEAIRRGELETYPFNDLKKEMEQW
ncbi:hypothetical protein [Campylobacter sp. RM15925]|uniref:hypothetical protein n=1 Tax=Campylobacter sp. RM15925 TaxID=1705724 RepID=UPI00147580A5|nr:hypothetical protein [Campylobacter sp. RM15925]